MTGPLAATFRKPFDEQVAALRLRLGNLVGTVAWDDLTKAQHDRAFMVAGALKADLLADLAAAVDRSIVDGTGLENFRKDFRAIVDKHGWHGWTGEGTAKGEAWRTKVIWRTNMATSYAAGRMAQLVDGKFKFWVYKHGGSLEPRLQHLAWDGVALPPEHPFWAEHYPPNGWGCSCRVFGTNSEAGIKRVGGDPDKALPDDWQRIDPKTGAPVGISKGWDYAPGASVANTIIALRGKLDVLPQRPAIDLIQSGLRSDAFAAWFANPVGDWPLARIAKVDADRIAANELVAYLSPESLAKQLMAHPELGLGEYQLAQMIVEQASRVVQDGDRALLYVFEVAASDSIGGYVLVIKATRSGNRLFVTSLRRLSRVEATRDAEVRRLVRKED